MCQNPKQIYFRRCVHLTITSVIFFSSFLFYSPLYAQYSHCQYPSNTYHKKAAQCLLAEVESL